LDQPALPDGMVWVWEAYDALSTERLYEGGAIPHSAAKL